MSGRVKFIGLMSSSCHIYRQQVNPLLRYCNLMVFKWWPSAMLDFLKIDILMVLLWPKSITVPNFVPMSVTVPNCVPIGQNNVKIWPFWDFEDGGFFKFAILTAGPVRRANVRHHANFHADLSNYCRDMAYFPFFNMAASCDLSIHPSRWQPRPYFFNH